MSNWKLDAACIRVVAIPGNGCEGCGEAPVTHFVEIDLDSHTRSLYEGCANCCHERAEEIRAMLPDAPEELES